MALLPVFYHILDQQSRYVKITAGIAIERDFRKFLKHIHRLEGFKKLTNRILDAFRGIISI